MAVEHNVIADMLLQKMAQHAPVTQNCRVNGASSKQMWLITWGHRSHEGQSRYNAVMGMIFGLLDEAHAEVDPRTELPDEAQAQTDDGNGEA